MCFFCGSNTGYTAQDVTVPAGAVAYNTTISSDDSARTFLQVDGGYSTGTTNSKPVLDVNGYTYQLTTQFGGAAAGELDTYKWANNNITYNFGNNSYSTESEDAYIVSMTATQKDYTRLSFELWDDFTNLNISESATSTANIGYNYASSTIGGGTYCKGTAQTWSGTTSEYKQGSNQGYAYNITHREIFLNSGWNTHNSSADYFFGGYAMQTAMHEIGHALGLSHPGTYDASTGTVTYAAGAEFYQDTNRYSIMSYFNAQDNGEAGFGTVAWNDGGFNYSTYRYSSTPMVYDIAAAQHLYGADYTTRSGNTTYGFNVTADINDGNAAHNFTTNRLMYDFTQNTTPVLAIWDGAGTDTLDLSGYAMAQRIDLTPGSYSDVGGLTRNVGIAFGCTIENAVGGSGNDTIIGNGVANTLKGGAGNDVLQGGLGLDKLTGSTGSDTFLADYTGASNQDHVTDFNRGNTSRYSQAEADVLDVSSLISTIISGGQATKDCVRLVENQDGTGAYLQVDTNGSVGGHNWETVATIDGRHQSETALVKYTNTSSSSINYWTAVDQSGDFNGDGKSDILWRNDDGLAAVWNMNGNQFLSGGSVGTISSDWNMIAVNDFDGNGKSDILWRYKDGTIAIWGMDGQNLVSGGAAGAISNEWHVIGTGDFNGDGKADIIWRHENGQLAEWNMNGNQLIGGGAAGAVAEGWHTAGVGDFNGDGKSDILWRHDNGDIVQWNMDGNQLVGGGLVSSLSTDWHILCTSDFNGDGKADILLRHDNGQIAEWSMNGTSIIGGGAIGAALSLDWSVSAVGDYNNDGKDDLMLRHINGDTIEWNLNGNQITQAGFVVNISTDWKVETHHYDFV